MITATDTVDASAFISHLTDLVVDERDEERRTTSNLLEGLLKTLPTKVLLS